MSMVSQLIKQMPDVSKIRYSSSLNPKCMVTHDPGPGKHSNGQVVLKNSNCKGPKHVTRLWFVFKKNNFIKKIVLFVVKSGIFMPV